MALIQMSFTPHLQKDREPTGSFLWRVEPGGLIR
jgi:hypothetical protein